MEYTSHVATESAGGIGGGIDQLRNGLIEVASVIVGQVERAVDAWETQDHAEAAQVVAGDDEVDFRCKELERLAFDLVLLQAPKAHDLRLIHAGLPTAYAFPALPAPPAYFAQSLAALVRQAPQVLPAIKGAGAAVARLTAGAF